MKKPAVVFPAAPTSRAAPATGLAAASVLLAWMLSGCMSMSGLSGSSSYACKAPDGVTCDSVSGTYANAVQNNLPSQRRTSGASPGTPQAPRATEGITGAAVAGACGTQTIENRTGGNATHGCNADTANDGFQAHTVNRIGRLPALFLGVVLGSLGHLLLNPGRTALRAPASIVNPTTSRFLGVTADIAVSCRQSADHPELIDVNVRNIGSHTRLIPFPTCEHGISFGPAGEIVVWLGTLRSYGDGLAPPPPPNMTELPPDARADFQANLRTDFRFAQPEGSGDHPSALQGRVHTTLRCVVAWLPRVEDLRAGWTEYGRIVRFVESAPATIDYEF